VTLVLIHGSAHTAAVWTRTQAALGAPSVALDLPGRASRPADITRVALPDAADQLAADLADVDGPLVLVGHSAGGMVLPFLAARLGERVSGLVFVAGLIARHGGRVVESVAPERIDLMTDRLAELRVEYAGCTLEDLPDARVAQSVDSLNLMLQPISWAGVADDLPRAWVRCSRDPIQPPALQAELAANAGAQRRVTIDSGHTPALDCPDELADLLARLLRDL
jgi:pimeloyl-ACP methyl ester carboxylesterase